MSHNFIDDVIDRNYGVISVISKCPYSRSPGVPIFADIIKIITRFSKECLRTQEKLKELEIMYQNAIYI